MANDSIWLIIAAVAALIFWILYDVVKGSKLPDGFEPIADKKIRSHENKISTKADSKAVSSPFAPGKRKLTAKP